MKFLHQIIELFGKQEELLLPAAIVAATVLAALAVFWIAVRNTEIKDPAFRWLGLFLGLGVRGSVRLSCSWIKLVIMIFYLTAFKQLDLSCYVLLMVPGMTYIFLDKKIVSVIQNIIWFAIETAGLFVINLICGYITEMLAGTIFVLIYVAAAVLMFIFSIYIFIIELSSISEERSIRPDREYRKYIRKQ